MGYLAFSVSQLRITSLKSLSISPPLSESFFLQNIDEIVYSV